MPVTADIKVGMITMLGYLLGRVGWSRRGCASHEAFGRSVAAARSETDQHVPPRLVTAGQGAGFFFADGGRAVSLFILTMTILAGASLAHYVLTRQATLEVLELSPLEPLNVLPAHLFFCQPDKA